MTRLVWLRCACYVWPCLPTAPVSRCGLCREYPNRPARTPADGKAHPL